MTQGQILLTEAVHKDTERSKKPCFNACGTCMHCADFTTLFAECRACYPDQPEYRALTGEWEHCHCKLLPFTYIVNGRPRTNIKFKPMNARTMQDSAREAIRQEQERAKHASAFLEADRARTQGTRS